MDKNSQKPLILPQNISLEILPPNHSPENKDKNNERIL